MDIWQACESGNIEYVRRYIASGRRRPHESGGRKSIDARNSWGATPVMYASQYGHEKIVCLLVENGADVNARISGGCTAIMLASEHGHSNIIELLAKNGVDVNAPDDYGKTPLMFVSRCCEYKKVIRTLVKFGANLDARNSKGNNVLSLALMLKSVEVALFLVRTMSRIREISYSAMPISLFVPKPWNWYESEYAGLTQKLVRTYLSRVTEDLGFASDMERDITEILGGKREKDRCPLPQGDEIILKKLLRTLRSSASKDADIFDDRLHGADGAREQRRRYLVFLRHGTLGFREESETPWIFGMLAD